MQQPRLDKDAFPAAAEDGKPVLGHGDSTPSEPASGSALAPISQASLALLDVVQGARASYLWSMLGWQDIRQRYRRSRLGPFWLTISMGVLVGTLGILYARNFALNDRFRGQVISPASARKQMLRRTYIYVISGDG